MTLSEMTVLAMDEILLRTEISRMRGGVSAPSHIAAHVFPPPPRAAAGCYELSWPQGSLILFR